MDGSPSGLCSGNHRVRAEVYDRVEEEGRREVQNPPGEEDRQIAREPYIYEHDRVGQTHLVYPHNCYLFAFCLFLVFVLSLAVPKHIIYSSEDLKPSTF